MMAVEIFNNILKYLNDQPKGNQTEEQLIRDIIQKGIDEPILRY